MQHFGVSWICKSVVEKYTMNETRPHMHLARKTRKSLARQRVVLYTASRYTYVIDFELVVAFLYYYDSSGFFIGAA